MASRVLAWAESVVLFAALYVGLPSVGLALDSILRWPSLPVLLRWIGIAPLVLGAAGVAWCFSLFVRVGGGTPNPIVPPQRLVTEGPFAWTRNPIILSHALASLGVALLVASPAAVLLVLLLGLPVQFVTRIEERSLEARFGDAYRAYRDSVPRWIPRRPRQSR
ncbi:MAG TPA: isoprenylcysteine carboxylmethyltransferase family protein [Thermoplasmata archaeon]|nr:isoprenylcysteine carboxylmethyltransferase family protein [Thermoplasmata archaeon]